MFFSFCKSGKPRRTCKCALCTVDDTCGFHVIRLGPKTSVHERHVSVQSAVTSCGVTNCATTLQGFNKHASSRREAVSDSRGVPRCTEKIVKNPHLLTCVDRSTRPIHHTCCFVIEHDCDATTFRSEVLRRSLRTFITSNVIWIKFVYHCSSSHVRKPHFVRSVAVPRCSLQQLRRLQNSPLQIAVQTSRIIINLCSSVLFQD